MVMKTKFVFVLFCGLLLSLAACSDDAENAITNIVDDPELNGRYVGECQDSELTGFSMRESLRFTVEGGFSRYQDFYTNADCSDAESAGTVEVSGQYTVDGDGAPEYEAIELNLNQASILPRSEALATAMSAVNFCGSDNFQAGEKQDISGGSDNLLCPVKDVPTTLYGVYREDDGDLYLNEGGLSSMSENPSERPATLDQESVYMKE